MVPSSHPYVSGMEVWLDTPRSCRMEEPESQQATSCSFAPSIKEESSYCLYDSEKCPKGSAATDLAPFPRLNAEVSPASGGGGVPVPGYFRLSQAYGTSKNYGAGPAGAASFPPQPPGRFQTSPSLPPVPDTGRKEDEERSPSPLACISQREDETQTSSSTAEDLSPAPSENSKASPEKEPVGKRMIIVSVVVMIKNKKKEQSRVIVASRCERRIPAAPRGCQEALLKLTF